MKKEKALDVFLTFLEEEVFSKADYQDYWLGALSLSLFRPALLLLLKNYDPILKLSGALNDNDEIDLDKLNDALNYAFDKQPTFPFDFKKYLPYLNFKSTFTQADAAELMKRLRASK